MERREFLKGAITASGTFTAQQAKAREGELQQAQYAIVELMGYKKLAGRLQQSPVPGMLQLDVPVEGGFVTQMINPSAVYRITLADEKSVKAVARNIDPLPTLELEIQPVQRSLSWRGEDDDDGMPF